MNFSYSFSIRRIKLMPNGYGMRRVWSLEMIYCTRATRERDGGVVYYNRTVCKNRSISSTRRCAVVNGDCN